MTWDDWEREVELWTDSFRYTTGAKHVDLDRSEVSVISTSVRRRPLGSKGGVREEHWCGNSAHRVATPLFLCGSCRPASREMVGTGHDAKGRFRGFRAIWNSIQQVLQGVRSGTESASAPHWMDTGKFSHPVIRRSLLIENSGLEGPEVSAILASQENSLRIHVRPYSNSNKTIFEKYAKKLSKNYKKKKNTNSNRKAFSKFFEQ